MPVPGDDLGRDGVGRQAKLFANVLLDLRVYRGVRAHRAAHAADRDIIGRPLETRPRSIELRHPSGHFEAERDGLCDDAVRTACHQRAAVTHGKLCCGIPDGGEVSVDDPRRLTQLHRHGGVVEVLAGHAEMHVARLRLADGIVDDRQERDHVVADALFDLGNFGSVKGRFADLGQGRCRNAA